MSIELYFIAVTSIIGVAWITYYILFPLIDGIIFSLGFTIFKILNIDPSKAVKHPLILFKYIIKNFIHGFIEKTCYYDTLVQCKTETWVWKPYFHYERRDEISKIKGVD
jgi:hypothetical protein